MILILFDPKFIVDAPSRGLNTVPKKGCLPLDVNLIYQSTKLQHLYRKMFWVVKENIFQFPYIIRAYISLLLI